MQEKTNNITFVTGIWDLQRGSAKEEWARPFDHYISNFIELLKELKHINLVIFIDPSLEYLVWSHRNKHNTAVYHHSKDQFSGNFFPFFDKVQQIRNDPAWYNQAGWLKSSTQGSLEYYNPMVMSKMFLLNNARIFNPFDSTYYYWIDGGISNTLSLGYFNNPTVIENLIRITKSFLFICFPYETDSEIHGFSIDGMRKYADSDKVDRVARGGFFGGHKDHIGTANGLYYHLLQSSLDEGYMGTEESIFTIMTYLEPYQYHYEMINSDGLVYTFFENLQKRTFKSQNTKDVQLYINTFKSPEQLQLLLDSIESNEPKLLDSTQKILINNTPTQETAILEKYDKITKQYNLTEIRRGNIGICGARQLAAEYFNESSYDYMLFFEDDMLLDYNGSCSFGFKKRIDNLLDNLINIMNKEEYDFLKLSFSEFYGHNGEQWSWHNVPQQQREHYFDNSARKPNTVFHHIKSLNSVPYADGEVYYSNWPHIINRTGNKKCFLDTKWNSPFEQTWMSHIYTLTKQKQIQPAILLASPITHYRKYHYEAAERKEN